MFTKTNNLFIRNFSIVAILPVSCVLNNLNASIRQLSKLIKTKQLQVSQMHELSMSLHSIFSFGDIPVTIRFMIVVIWCVNIVYSVIEIKRHSWFMLLWNCNEINNSQLEFKKRSSIEFIRINRYRLPRQLAWVVKDCWVFEEALSLVKVQAWGNHSQALSVEGINYFLEQKLSVR